MSNILFLKNVPQIPQVPQISGTNGVALSASSDFRHTLTRYSSIPALTQSKDTKDRDLIPASPIVAQRKL